MPTTRLMTLKEENEALKAENEALRMAAARKTGNSTAAVMQVVIDEWNLYLRECKHLLFIEKEEWGWRYWRMLEDTPYTRGEKDLAGWNSQDDNLKGKEAFI